MKKINVLKLSEKLLERYESQHEKVKGYYGLLAYYALAQIAVAGENEELLKKCTDYLALYPDQFEHPYYSFESYRVGGNGKAWLLFKGLTPEWEDEIREYAEKMLTAPVDEGGIMCLPTDVTRRKIWIDVVSGITPFMLYAGLYFKEERYIEFAAEQCFKMYEVFLDQTCGLLHQTRGFMANPKRMSHDHWSRGNGWCMIGLAELVRYLPVDSKHREKAETYFVDLVDALLPYQTERGLWRQEIIEPLSWEESSGTALLLYGIGIGMRTGLLKESTYKEAFEKGIQALGTYCLKEDFSTYRSCPGCRCPGEGAEKGTVKAYIALRIPQKDEVHSYGCMMLAFIEAYKNGISEIEICGNTN